MLKYNPGYSYDHYNSQLTVMQYHYTSIVYSLEIIILAEKGVWRGFISVVSLNIVLGLTKWRAQAGDDDKSIVDQVYGAPFERFDRFFKRLPFMPNFRENATSISKIEPDAESGESDL